MALIKCPECGREVSDTANACINCGYDIRKHLKNIKKNDNKERISKLNKKLFAIPVVVIIVALVFVTKLFISNDVVELSGKFYRGYVLGEKDNYYEFNQGKVNYVIKDVELSGTYTYDSDSVVVTRQILGDETFIRYKNYLILEGYEYSGEIPDSDRFDLVCEYKDKKIVFYSDGSVDLDGKNATYTRKDDKIVFDIYGKSEDLQYLIYKNHITNSYYEKID